MMTYTSTNFDGLFGNYLNTIEQIYNGRNPGEYTEWDLDQIELAAHRLITLVEKQRQL